MAPVMLTPTRIQPRFEPRVSLSLEGVDPERVSEQLGIPSDLVLPPSVIERLESEGTQLTSWALDTHDHVRTNRLADHVAWITARLAGKMEAFRKIAEVASSAELRLNGPDRKWELDKATIDRVNHELGVRVVFVISHFHKASVVAADDLSYRPARAGDSDAIAGLLDELGYPALASEVPARLAELAKYPNTLALVAADGAEVVGIVTAQVFPSLHASEPVAWITSMVVSSQHRGRGIGSELVERAERWALEKGAVKVSLTSALHREEAHAFYQKKQLYEKTGLRFSKLLVEPAGI